VIKINLIQAPVREREVKFDRAATTSQRNAIYALAAAVVCFGIVGLFYWSWNHEISALNTKIEAARLEAARLAGIQAENRNYETELAQIQNHIVVIQALEKTRTGPQDLMTRLGSAAGGVDGIYLTSVKSDAGRLLIEGESDHLTAVADFISALQNDSSFQQIELNQVYEDDQNTQVIFKFDLVCLYMPPVETAASVPPAAPAGDSGRPPGR
jgi:Tfp pilus assembly protein PilN